MNYDPRDLNNPVTWPARPGRYAVIDVETTGFSPLRDRVVEVAVVILQDGLTVKCWSSLVNPEREIPDRATAIHGLTDDDVAQSPTLDEIEGLLRELCDGATVVAHNASFDLSFLPMLHDRPHLCTVALARRAFPQAPDYKNQTLRRYLNVDRDPAMRDLNAHRALADAQVTAAILLQCLRNGGDRHERVADGALPARAFPDTLAG